MTTKPILHAIGNDKEFNYYIIDKKNYSLQKFSDILCEIFKIEIPFHEEIPDKRRGYIQKKINYENFKDYHLTESSDNGEERIDVFIGKKRVFVALRCDSKSRLNFNEELLKIFKMPEYKKIKTKKK